MIDFFCIRHRLPSDEVLKKWDLGRILQLMHAEAVHRGGMFQWVNFFDPSPKLMDAFDAAANAPATDWAILEPQFS